MCSLYLDQCFKRACIVFHNNKFQYENKTCMVNYSVLLSGGTSPFFNANYGQTSTKALYWVQKVHKHLQQWGMPSLVVIVAVVLHNLYVQC